MRARVGGTLLLAVVVTGCFGAAPTPQIIYVTPAPTTAPTTAPTPTATPEPTFTGEDMAIDQVIRDGVDELQKRADDLQVLEGSLATMVDAFQSLRDWADLEQTRIVIFEPSVCTKAAVSLYLDGMAQIEQSAQDYLDWLAAGAPEGGYTTDAAYEAARTVGSALVSLEGSPCE